MSVHGAAEVRDVELRLRVESVAGGEARQRRQHEGTKPAENQVGDHDAVRVAGPRLLRADILAWAGGIRLLVNV